MKFLDHPDGGHHPDMCADDCDADGGGNCLHCLLLSHQHCLGEKLELGILMGLLSLMLVNMK